MLNKKLGKTNVEIVKIAGDIINRCDGKVLDCKVHDDTIEILTEKQKIVMRDLYKDYYIEDVTMLESNMTFSRLNLLNYCPAVNTIYEINSGGQFRYDE